MASSLLCGKANRIKTPSRTKVNLNSRSNPLDLENNTMNTLLLRLHIGLQTLTSSEEGQDLVEYALVVALIAFGATTGMKALATGLNSAFRGISTTLGSYVS